ncbi:hypothetical protein Tcan_13795 [Toxocara canis]|uniref:Origin recognition complex subunit 3 N-terminal domain-containing protein n=1 Tax=Toxocara canis TaxID=6265 RepID=A0A0B2VCL6_TOXCA|nr:hypothetical protein Tcan_13795 [Toxocara canis]
MTISADMSIIYSRCSRESYTRLSIRRFEFPAPTMAMNAFLDAVTFNPHFGLRVDGKLFDELRRNFLERCFSIEQLKKMVRLAVLNFFIANEDLEFDVEEGTLHIERYVLFLHLLYDLCEGLPLQPRFIYDLHSELQSKASFFTDRDGSFWQWKSVWLTWEVEEIIEAINKLLPHVKELDTSLHAELQKLLMDMNDLERRKSAMSEETASVDSEHSSMVCAPTTKLRSHSAMQQQMRERMALAKKLDPLSSCRQRFVKLLTKIFEIVLKPFDAVGVLSKGLLRGGESLSALTTPRIAERLEESVAGNNLHLKKGWRSQVDLCVAYRTLQNAALYAKNIAIVEWARNFEKHACPMEGVDPSTRLYKCIADLELMGIIKAVSDNCISAVHLLQPPSTLIVDVE